MRIVARLLLILALLRPCLGALSPLAKAPDWSILEKYQTTITRERFSELLNRYYAPNAAASAVIQLTATSARILQHQGAWFELRFAEPDSQKQQPGHTIAKPTSPDRPLAGYTIALDPGHLGGPWAKMEERWFQIGDGRPVAEGDMTLLVAKILSKKLERLGAAVLLVRDSPTPTTAKRPDQLRKRAVASLGVRKLTPERIRRESERLFYRVSEIRGRALFFVNQSLKPDLTICLHFNAEAWGDPNNPLLTATNHFHFLVNGAYSAGELALADVRMEMLLKLLSGGIDEEIALSETLGAAMQKQTGLPAFEYRGEGAVRVGRYSWARNLLANRLYQCPVVFAEPYVMNNRTVYERVQMGAYEGQRLVDNAPRPNLYEEYATAIAEGLKDYFQKKDRLP